MKKSINKITLENVKKANELDCELALDAPKKAPQLNLKPNFSGVKFKNVKKVRKFKEGIFAKKEKTALKPILKDGVLTSNPLFISLLGLCPALAITDKVMNAVGMTFAFLFVLLMSNVTISLLRKVIPNEIRIPVYIIIVATFVTCVKLLMQAFTPSLYNSLSLFINLIVVNCIILGRAEAFASKNSVGASAVDAVAQALGYGLALFVLAFVREILATQSITLSNPFDASQSITFGLLEDFKIGLFADKAGAFILFAIALATISAISSKIAAKKKGAK